MIIQGNALSLPIQNNTAILWYNKRMDNKRDNQGRFVQGIHYSPKTEFKKGEHWRPEKPFWNRDWLYQEYVTNNLSSKEIADQFGITESAILFWMRKHGIAARSMKEIRSKKKWGLSGEKNGMYGKTGELSRNWKGGCTPERQSFYISQEWKRACSAVYKRDNARCVRCGADSNLHIHHIESFANKEKRADIGNLVLLCVKCHRWAHSKKNINKEYIREEVQDDYSG